jgi:hypothetical protein
LPEGLFIHLDLATLQEMQTEWKACLTAIATAHQSYSIAGRSFTRADLKQVSEMVSEIAYAIQAKSGGLTRTVYADLSE